MKTNRDAWTYNFSLLAVRDNMSRMVDFYNSEVDRYKRSGKPSNVDEFVESDPKKISWTREVKGDLRKGKKFQFDASSERVAMYRPFCKQHMYFNRQLNNTVYQIPNLFPEADSDNLVISVSGIGASKAFSALITNTVPNLHLHDTGQCFPLYYYDKTAEINSPILGDTDGQVYTRWIAITDRFLEVIQTTYSDNNIAKEDIFYYCYGILYSPEYKKNFSSDLKKMLPRLPLVEDFWGFSSGGRDLASWHLNYESVDPYPIIDPSESDHSLGLKVEKMRFAKGKDGKPDRSAIIYNSAVTISEIPLEAYDYQVNGKSAIEWIMDRYQITADRDSGIKNDPNDYSDDPRYIVDLLKRIIRVSLETNRIVKELPPLTVLDADRNAEIT